MTLSLQEIDLLAYYHLSSCAWVAHERNACSCGLLGRVAAIAASPDMAVS